VVQEINIGFLSSLVSISFPKGHTGPTGPTPPPKPRIWYYVYNMGEGIITDGGKSDQSWYDQGLANYIAFIRPTNPTLADSLVPAITDPVKGAAFAATQFNAFGSALYWNTLGFLPPYNVFQNPFPTMALQQGWLALQGLEPDYAGFQWYQ
jgi:hypothetical protein